MKKQYFIFLIVFFKYIYFTSAQILVTPEELHTEPFQGYVPQEKYLPEEVPYHHNYEYISTGNRRSDTLQYSNKQILLYKSPLLDFKNITKNLVHKNEESMITVPRVAKSCYRQFTAQWIIRNDSLFLGKVSPYRDIVLSEDWPWPSSDEANRRLEKAIGHKYKNGLIFANWVNGTLLGGADGKYITKQLTAYYIYPNEYWITVKNGIILHTEHYTANNAPKKFIPTH